MTIRDELTGKYFEWLCDAVCERGLNEHISHRKLLEYLHAIDFRVIVSMDDNRSGDGISLRYYFAREMVSDHDEALDIANHLDGPCSVLEMLVALARRLEEFMDDPSIGDRTRQWFWTMIRNLGLSSMVDSRFDARYVSEVVNRFLDREYSPNGRGGLFYIENPRQDLRDVEIWWQACWYLNSIT